MILGKILGEVWATRQHAAYDGKKMVLVQPTLFHGDAVPLVAIDTIDASVGDHVVVCTGTPARHALGGMNLPFDAAVCAIVDRLELDEDVGKRPLVPIGEMPGDGS